MKEADVERIFLIGMPGCGKSTEGKKLARTLQWKFLDLDDAIETATQQSIATIFETHGETFFREAEHGALLQCINESKVVIACGGGTPAFYNNMELMLSTGLCVYLKASPTFLSNRIQQGKRQRPMFQYLNTRETEEKIQKILIDRSSFYEQAPIQISMPIKGPKPLSELIFPQD